MGSLSAARQSLEFLLSNDRFKCVAVVCREDRPRQTGESYTIDLARDAGIPIVSLDEMPDAEIGLAVRFDQILSAAHRARFRFGVINLHGAPLPEMRGSLCECAAILEERDTFGASLHLMDDGIDTGPLIAQERFPIPADATAGSLLREANRRGVALIEEHLANYVDGAVTPIPQELSAGRTYRRREVLRARDPARALGPEGRDRVARAFCYDPGGYRETRTIRDRLAAIVGAGG